MQVKVRACKTAAQERGVVARYDDKTSPFCLLLLIFSPRTCMHHLSNNTTHGAKEMCVMDEEHRQKREDEPPHESLRDRATQ